MQGSCGCNPTVTDRPTKTGPRARAPALCFATRGPLVESGFRDYRIDFPHSIRAFQFCGFLGSYPPDRPLLAGRLTEIRATPRGELLDASSRNPCGDSGFGVRGMFVLIPLVCFRSPFASAVQDRLRVDS